uniref:Choline/carnitine acyltransferase domain-containing protein n=1 Tax=Oryctolagus cuniculus TaxID=9986 RepID=A0A5F9DQ04_RABIT
SPAAAASTVKPLGLLKPSSLMKVSGRFKAHQDALPRLPVPPLQQSLGHYLQALQPIVSEEEWAHTKQLVEEFQTSGGVGERLQKGLERRARKTENWVSEGAGGGAQVAGTGCRRRSPVRAALARSPTCCSSFGGASLQERHRAGLWLSEEL